jgi:filamentous hemagglutinin family protein
VENKFKFRITKICGKAVSALCGIFASTMLMAAPTGGVYTVGSGSISQNGLVTTVTPGVGRTDSLIDWSTFDVSPGESVNFGHSEFLHRFFNVINDSKASVISGAINGTGTRTAIYLLNRNGITFNGAQINSTGDVFIGGIDAIERAKLVTNLGQYELVEYDFNGVYINMHAVGSIDIINSSITAEGRITGRTLGNLSVVDSAISSNIGLNAVPFGVNTDSVAMFFNAENILIDNSNLTSLGTSSRAHVKLDSNVNLEVINNSTLTSQQGIYLLSDNNSLLENSNFSSKTESSFNAVNLTINNSLIEKTTGTDYINLGGFNSLSVNVINGSDLNVVGDVVIRSGEVVIDSSNVVASNSILISDTNSVDIVNSTMIANGNSFTIQNNVVNDINVNNSNIIARTNFSISGNDIVLDMANIESFGLNVNAHNSLEISNLSNLNNRSISNMLVLDSGGNLLLQDSTLFSNQNLIIEGGYTNMGQPVANTTVEFIDSNIDANGNVAIYGSLTNLLNTQVSSDGYLSISSSSDLGIYGNTELLSNASEGSILIQSMGLNGAGITLAGDSNIMADNSILINGTLNTDGNEFIDVAPTLNQMRASQYSIEVVSSNGMVDVSADVGEKIVLQAGALKTRPIVEPPIVIPEEPVVIPPVIVPEPPVLPPIVPVVPPVVQPPVVDIPKAPIQQQFGVKSDDSVESPVLENNILIVPAENKVVVTMGNANFENNVVGNPTVIEDKKEDKK